MGLNTKSILTYAISILLLPLIYGYGNNLFYLISSLNLKSDQILSFIIPLGVAFTLSLLFVSASSYIAILNHELTHNFLAVLTFNKPTELQVSSGQGGNFVYRGRKNFLTVLSPYFFPLTTAFIFPLYFIIAKESLIYYFILLGLSFGFSLSTAIKQMNFSQPDLKIYGRLPSYIIILFFQILTISVLLSFTDSRFSGCKEMFISGFQNVIKILNT